MTRDWESVFGYWSAGPSTTEVNRLENAWNRIRKAIKNNAGLNSRDIKVFKQGSYRNRVNVRQDSDVDVGVMLHQYFLYDIPPGMSPADFRITDAPYSFHQFKNELRRALADYFGESFVTRGNKAIKIRGSSYQVEADVAPFFEFRQFARDGNHYVGVALLTDSGVRIINYPERLLSSWPLTRLHYENGVWKNTSTSRRFKRVVRVLKKLRNEMEDNGAPSASAIPGYLLECMAWNIENAHFEEENWYDRVKTVLLCMKIHIRDDEACRSWSEVDGIKILFHKSQPWSRAAAYAFVLEARRYIGAE